MFRSRKKRLKRGDFARGENQQKVLKAMLDKAMSPKIITNFNNILSAVEGCFETDMSDKEIKSLINMQLMIWRIGRSSMFKLKVSIN